MKHLQLVILVLVCVVVGKLIIVGLSLAEALVAFSLIGYHSFLNYIEWRKAKEVQLDFEKRITQVETKLAMLNIGKSMMK